MTVQMQIANKQMLTRVCVHDDDAASAYKKRQICDMADHANRHDKAAVLTKEAQQSRKRYMK